MKSMHDQTKRVYRTSPGWKLTLWICAAAMVLLGAIPFLAGYDYGEDRVGAASFVLVTGFLAVMAPVSVVFPWLAISDYGIEVSLLFYRVYTPWDNVKAMVANPYGLQHLYLVEPVHYELWPFKFGGRTKTISASSYGRKEDCLYEQIADHINRHSSG